MGVLFDFGPIESALTHLLESPYPPADLTPPMRIPNSATRAAHTKSIHLLLIDIAATRKTIEVLKGKLDRLKDGLCYREAAVRTNLAPVASLPPEVLGEIFLFTMAQTPTSRTSLILSHVNSSWRAISISTRELWTHIQVPSRSDGEEMFKEFALRSGALPLHIVRLGHRPGADNTVSLNIDIHPVHAS